MTKLTNKQPEDMKWDIRQDFHNAAEGIVFELESIIWGIALKRLLQEYGDENRETIEDILNRPQNPQRKYYGGDEAGPWYYGIRPRLSWTGAVEQIRPEIEEYVLSGRVPTEITPVLLTPAVLRNMVAQNLGDIERGLNLEAIEHKTGVGRIDVLASDENGGLVVVEVKSGKADESALGSCLSTSDGSASTKLEVQRPGGS